MTSAAVKRQRSLKAAALLLAMGFAVAIAWWLLSTPSTVRLAVAAGSGDAARLAQAIERRSNDGRWPVRLRVQVRDSAAEVADAFSRREADVVVLRGDIPLPDDAQLAAVWRRNVLVLVARETSGVKEFAELAGRTIAVVGRDPDDTRLLRTLFALNGLAFDPERLVETTAADLAVTIESRGVDVVAFFGPTGSRLPAEFERDLRAAFGTPVFIPVRNAAALVRQNPQLDVADIPAGTFGLAPPTPEADVPSLGFSHLMLVRRTLPNATVAALTRAIFEARPGLARENPAATRIQQPDSERDRFVTTHRGATFYFDAEEEKTFFERYGDYLWLLVFGSGFFASIFAWLWQLLRPAVPDAAPEPPLHMLDLAARAREAPDERALEAVEADIEETLRGALASFSPFGGDDGAARLRLALDYAQAAVARRRLALGGNAACPPPQHGQNPVPTS